MTIALIVNCLAQRRSFCAASNRFAGGQSAAISSSSGSSITRQNFPVFIPVIWQTGLDKSCPTQPKLIHKMRFLTWFLIVAFGAVLCGCAGNDEAFNQLNDQMSPEWLKSHIIIGQTTKEEVRLWFGKPLVENSMAGSGLAAALMPDEIWTYSVRFSQLHKSWINPYYDNWTKSIAFSFKNGVVSNYNVNNVQF